MPKRKQKRLTKLVIEPQEAKFVNLAKSKQSNKDFYITKRKGKIVIYPKRKILFSDRLDILTARVVIQPNKDLNIVVDKSQNVVRPTSFYR